MTALSATVLPDGAVSLAVTGAPAGAVVLRRVDRNGFATVRQPLDLPTTGDRTVVDWEVALAGPVRYLLLDADGVQTYATTTMVVGEALPQLRRVHRPALGGPLDAVVSMTAPQALRYTAHEPIGRADTVYTTFRMGGRAGQLVYRCATLQAAQGIRDLYADGQECLLRTPDHDGLDVFHLALSVEPAVQDDDTWLVTVGYAEVVPGAATTLAAWTLDDIDAAYPDLASVALAFATVDDLGEDRPVVA